MFKKSFKYLFGHVISDVVFVTESDDLNKVLTEQNKEHNLSFGKDFHSEKTNVIFYKI